MGLKTIRARVEYFRRALEGTLRAHEKRNDKYSRGVAAIVRALLSDFDRAFSPSILDGTAELHPLIEEYCYKWPRCPICGSKMYAKKGRFGDFHGCSRYPDCKGVRGTDKQASINDALKFFLTEKVFEENTRANTSEDRFTNLDL